jgi:hypothetical protein
MTESSLGMQNRGPALWTLVDELRSTENAEELLFQHVREVTTFWAKTVAVDALSFAGHEHPLVETSLRTRENACEMRRKESLRDGKKGLDGWCVTEGDAALRCAIPYDRLAGRRAQTET